MEIELSAAEKELIIIKRNEDKLAAERKIAEDKVKYDNERITNKNVIYGIQKNDDAQVAKAKEYLAVLGAGWTLKLEEWKDNKTVEGDYIDPDHKASNYHREIIFEDEYDRKWASLVNGEYKVSIEEHIVDTSRDRYFANEKNRGFKMRLTGPGLDYNQEKRFIAKPATILKNYKAILDQIENVKKRNEKAKNSHDEAFTKYSMEFPTAQIKKDTEWEYNQYDRSRRGQSINVIDITFANGIKIKYKIYDDGSVSRKSLTFPGKDQMELLNNLDKMKFES